jgi:outer membrane protein
VNKFLLSASAVAALALAGVFAANVSAQANKPAAAQPAASNAPHKVALIDMAYVFKTYEKFNNLRDDLKVEVQQGEETAKAKAEALKNLQAKMKTFQESSPEYTQTEQQLAKASAEFESFRRAAQRDFLKKESQIYHTVYMDVSDMVRKYAEHFNYTLVIRFNREDLEIDNPQKLIEGMNRQVVFFREEDDITDAVTDALNIQFKKQAGGATARPATPPGPKPTTSGTRPAPQTGGNPPRNQPR